MRTFAFIALVSLISVDYAGASLDSPLGHDVAEPLAQDKQEKKKEPFVPKSGMPGKDVIWVATSTPIVNKMLEVAKVTPADYVIDLGSGDGRNVIAAAKVGARGLGVEYNPDFVELSQKLAKEAGVADKARFVQGDMFVADISKATVLMLFLLPSNMDKLVPNFLTLAPGSRIVANTHGIKGWEPDVRVTLPRATGCEAYCTALMWIVPAKVQGTWTWPNGQLELTQQYQVVQGTATIAGAPAQVTKGKLNGAELTFIAGGQTYQGKVKGNRIDGTVTTSSGPLKWSAVRK